MCFKKLTAILLSVCILLFALGCGFDITQTTPNFSSQSSSEQASENLSNSSNLDFSSSLDNSSHENSSSITEDSSVQDSSSTTEDSSNWDSSSVTEDSSITDKPDDVVPPSYDYDSITKAEFYANYTLATSSEDAKKRSEYGLMSGSL